MECGIAGSSVWGVWSVWEGSLGDNWGSDWMISTITTISSTVWVSWGNCLGNDWSSISVSVAGGVWESGLDNWCVVGSSVISSSGISWCNISWCVISSISTWVGVIGSWCNISWGVIGSNW